MIVCRIGSRSGYAADALVAAGYDAATWRAACTRGPRRPLPLEPAGGYVL